MAILIVESDNARTLWHSIAAPTTYAATHDAAVGSVSDNMTLGQDYLSDVLYWEVYRDGLQFPLTGVAGKTITAATLSLYGTGDTSNTDFDITIVSGTDLGATLVGADYGDLLNDTTSFGALTTVGLVVGGWNVITINTAGLAAINAAIAAGVIRFGLRSSRDISSTDPKQNGGDWYEYVDFSGHTVLNQKPKLTLTYGVSYPTDTSVRVSSITHRYDRGVYNMELGLGDVLAGFGVPKVNTSMDKTYESKEAQSSQAVVYSPPSVPTEDVRVIRTIVEGTNPTNQTLEAKMLRAEIESLTKFASVVGLNDYSRSVLLKRILELKNLLGSM